MTDPSHPSTPPSLNVIPGWLLIPVTVAACPCITSFGTEFYCPNLEVWSRGYPRQKPLMSFKLCPRHSNKLDSRDWHLFPHNAIQLFSYWRHLALGPGLGGLMSVLLWQFWLSVMYGRGISVIFRQHNIMSLNCTAEITEGLDAMTGLLIVITSLSVCLLLHSVTITTYHPGLLFWNLRADSGLNCPSDKMNTGGKTFIVWSSPNCKKIIFLPAWSPTHNTVWMGF